MVGNINALPKWARAKILAQNKKLFELEIDVKFWEKKAKAAEATLKRIGYKEA